MIRKDSDKICIIKYWTVCYSDLSYYKNYRVKLQNSKTVNSYCRYCIWAHFPQAPRAAITEAPNLGANCGTGTPGGQQEGRTQSWSWHLAWLLLDLVANWPHLSCGRGGSWPRAQITELRELLNLSYTLLSVLWLSVKKAPLPETLDGSFFG